MPHKRFLFLDYLRDRLLMFGAIVILAVVFWIIFYLGSVPTALFGYAYILAVFFIVLFILADFYRYRKKHACLTDVYNRICVELKGLPRPENLIEQDYQKILGRMYHELQAHISEEDARSKEMTDYYTLWAHQIKTPITAMNLLLQAGNDPGKAELSQQLLKIERYVEMVLQYLRMENMSSDLKLSEYSIKKMVSEAVKKDRTVFIHRKISLDLEEIENKALTDEKWLEFVIEQILSNALKYTEPGGHISIYMEKGKENTLVIQDDGIGIKEEDLPRVFENGFTGYNGRMEKKSTGIGLYLCRQIMDKLGHSIRIDSVRGKGTKVMLDLSRQKLITE